MSEYTPKGDLMSSGFRPIARVIIEVSKVTGVPVDDILGPSRASHIVRARFAAMAICRHHLKAKYEAIGMAFRRDHTSIMNAIKRVDERATAADWADMHAIAKRCELIEADQ